MNVLLLSLERFEKADTGQGIPRYIKELYNNMKQLISSYDININKKIFKSFKLLGDGFSFEIGSFLSYRIGEEIVHNPIGFTVLHRLSKNSKYIVTLHDLNPIASKRLKARIWHSLVFERGLSYTLKRANAIIVNSTQTRDELIERGYNRKDIHVVSLGIDWRFLKEKCDNIKNSKKKFNVGYIGSFAPNKNVKFVIDACRSLNPTKVKFEMWGKKTYDYYELNDMAKNCMNMKFMGFAPEAKLINIYDSFDVFVFPSLYEGFGLPILEAQARGLPVIIYKYGKIPKEVRKYCFEAESPEHVAEIIEDLKENGYNEKLRNRATRYARSFTWEKTAKETLEVYKKVVE